MLVIENGDVYTPEPRGKASVLIAGGRIEAVGDFDTGALARQFDCEVVDASGCIVAPGLIDPHCHLIGGSGEKGFASQTPPIATRELLDAGITTVVGTLGTDTTTKSLASLLARVKGLREEGLNALMWTGGYDAKSITANVRDDMILIEEVIGAGELAIADRRGMHHTARELVRLATDCHIAGSLTGKAGVLHLHVGEAGPRLRVIREMLDEFEIPPATLYPTHVNRNEALFDEAVELTRRGVAVDCDLVEGDFGRWLKRYDGDPSMLTISTDAPIGRVTSLLDAIRDVAGTGIVPLERALALATSNTARVLKLRDVGRIERGMRADVLLLDAKTLELRAVVRNGLHGQ